MTKAQKTALEFHCRLAGETVHYCIHSDGIVFSCRTRGGLFRDWTPMVPNWSHHGTKRSRMFVNLRKDNKAYPKTVHRLVLEAFRGPCPSEMQGCHNDGDPSNNRLDNLRWDTHLSNMEDRHKHGTTYIGKNNPAALLNEAQVMRMRRLNLSGILQKDLAPMFGVSKQCVQAVCSYDTWQHVDTEHNVTPKKRRRKAAK